MADARTDRRLPVGAEALPGRRAFPRLGAAPPPRRGGVRERTRFRTTDARRRGLLLRPRPPRPAPAASTVSGWTTTRTPIPIRPRAFSRRGRTARRRSSTPSTFAWTDQGWRGAGLKGQVIYEMHVGTFTREGTWDAAIRELPELAALGITVLEVMPVADFPGRFGWGYDGVNCSPRRGSTAGPTTSAASSIRPTPPASASSSTWFTTTSAPTATTSASSPRTTSPTSYKNEWGEAINFDGPDAGPVREFFVANAGYWIDEFHLDGLRLDATQQIFDASPDHILAAIGRRVREAARGRATLIVAENEPQEVRLVRPARQGRLRPRRPVERRLPPHAPSSP